jgi:hypothetical protein
LATLPASQKQRTRFPLISLSSHQKSMKRKDFRETPLIKAKKRVAISFYLQSNFQLDQVLHAVKVVFGDSCDGIFKQH